MPIPVVLIFLKSYKNMFPTVTSNIPKSLLWKSALHYVSVITVFRLMNPVQAVRLWVTARGELCADPPGPVPPSTVSSVLTLSELIKILTYRTLGWRSHLTSDERPCQVRYRTQRHSRDIIVALKTSIFRKKQHSVKCHLHFHFMAWQFWGQNYAWMQH